MVVYFFSEKTSFVLDNESRYRNWIRKVASHYSVRIAHLNYIFCSDKYLLKINRDYLKHDDYTDVVTFDYSESTQEIEGEIYISIDRVRENADRYKQEFTNELSRVMIHGLLHLMGYGDKTEAEQTKMKEREDACLFLR